MAALLLLRPAFVAAVTQRIDWLADNRPEEQLDNFLIGLNWVRDRIAENPGGGPILKQDERHTLRLRLFPRPLPYLVYYAHRRDGPVREVFLVRLFGSGQRRAKIQMSQWPW
jgi:hypothetical protein